MTSTKLTKITISMQSDKQNYAKNCCICNKFPVPGKNSWRLSVGVMDTMVKMLSKAMVSSTLSQMIKMAACGSYIGMVWPDGSSSTASAVFRRS